MKVHDFKGGVTLPYSGNCFFVHVLTGKEEEFPKQKCDELKKRSVIITSEDWKIIKTDIQSSCQLTECTQLTGKFDALFLTIDNALQKIP